MKNKVFNDYFKLNMAMESVKGSFSLEGIDLDEEFLETCMMYFRGEISWQQFKSRYPYIGEEPLLDNE